MPECNFYVGQKVTPITSNWKRARRNWNQRLSRLFWGFDRPLACIGEVYTVRVVGTIDGYPNDHIFIGLCEKPGSYSAHGFRPVLERKTDISIFTKILDRVNRRQTVGAD
jgi:hypothetical protein